MNNPSSIHYEELLFKLQSRFDHHMNRHNNYDWSRIVAKLAHGTNGNKLHSLYQMEQTGGEPDVVDYDESANEFIFFDCSVESPTGRRSVCYDREALESRKKFPPKDNAIDMAGRMGIEILDETQYRKLQGLGNFDTRTSSWLKTPSGIREHGGAIFGDYRFGRVFIYHNGAESYYGARGFRGCLRV